MTNYEYLYNTDREEFAIFLESLRGCPPPLYDQACPEGDESLTYHQCINCWKNGLIHLLKLIEIGRDKNDN